MRGHCYDALVGLAGCDKSLPGMMMAMLRLNVPSVFIYGGSILPGRFRGRDVTVVDVFEAVGQHAAGSMSAEDLHELEASPARRPAPAAASSPPTPWRCVSEAIGLALPGSAGAPAPYEDPRPLRRGVGRAVMELLEQQHPPARHRARARRSRMPPRVVAATGGSTNAGAAPAGDGARGGHRVRPVRRRRDLQATPYIADLKPGGKYVAKDMYEAGGIPVMMKALLDGGLLHGDCLTVTGKTLAENLKDVSFPEPNQDVICPASTAAHRRPAAWSGCRGNLAPDGAIVKVAGMERAAASPARRVCFDCEEDALRRRRRTRDYKEGEVIVIRYEGPKGGPGMREMLSTTAALYGQGMGEQGGADHRRPLLGRARAASASAMSGRRRRSAARSPCSRTATSSRSTRRRARSTCELSDASSPSAARRGSRARPTTSRVRSGNTRSSSARRVDGAVTHPGAEAETHVLCRHLTAR